MTADIEAIGKDIVDIAYRIHKEFGPGLLESAYQACHVYALRKRGRIVQAELTLPIEYDGKSLTKDIELTNWWTAWLSLRTKPLTMFIRSIWRNSHVHETQERQTRLSDKLERETD